MKRLSWVLLAIAVAAAATALGCALPDWVKPVGLFFAIWAAAVGGLLGALARRWGLPGTGLLLGTACVCFACGEAIMVVRAFRAHTDGVDREVARKRTAWENSAASQIAAAGKAKQKPSDPQDEQAWADFRAFLDREENVHRRRLEALEGYRTFDGFLRYRMEAFPLASRLPQPWGARLLFGSELVLGLAVGLSVVRWTAGSRTSANFSSSSAAEVNPSPAP